MGEAVGAVLTYAVGVGISPVPVIAVILMLFSARARVNGPMFLAGWVTGLVIVAGGSYLLADLVDVGTADSTTSDGVSWLKVALGVLLLLAAIRNWRNRPHAGEAPTMPKWMNGIDSFTPVKAFGLAAVLSGVNPKNLMLCVGAGTTLAQLDPTSAEAVAALAVFVAVASSVVAVAVIGYLVGGEHARTALDDFKSWLTAHNNAVMAVLFLVFAAVLISEGLGVLG